MKLAVLGSESVTMSAGTFDAWMVELSSPDDENKTTLWIEKDAGRMVKAVLTGPQLNGAVATMELKP